ncbi:MAG: hypothetical protein JWN15_2110, partial [Firmicutes bacterium]|nr:hypothetical protein [Bacillota bacterium]
FKSPGKAAALVSPFRALLKEDDDEIVRRLGVLTAMARELTRYDPEAVQGIAVEVSPSQVELRLRSVAGIGSEVERLEALAGDFRKAWGRGLSVGAAG